MARPILLSIVEMGGYPNFKPLYEKAGFRHEGCWRQAEFRHGRYHDLLWMSVLREEWTG